MNDLDEGVRGAVRHFWTTRERQAKQQGSATGRRDQGFRSAVTGGAQMKGFVHLIRDLLIQSGIPEPSVYCERSLELPGFFRPEKCWDLLVVVQGTLLASIEFKSQVGPSFGNNYNNRTEEALGSAVDLWAAYREGAFRPSARPWLGYLMLLEETVKSTTPVKARQPHFNVFPEFKDASYAKRYEVLLTKLVRERLYDGACFLMSDPRTGRRGNYREPSVELGFRNFAQSLVARAMAHVKTMPLPAKPLKAQPGHVVTDEDKQSL